MPPSPRLHAVPTPPRPGRVALHDVADVNAFVHAEIRRFEARARTRNTNFRLADDERDELAAEGLLIMVQLAGRYEPRRPGHDQDGRFSGFAAAYLPRKLGDAWHRLHPHHHYVTITDVDVDGRQRRRRQWQYGKRPISIERLHEKNMDHDEAADRAAEKFLDPRYWVPDAAAA